MLLGTGGPDVSLFTGYQQPLSIDLQAYAVTGPSTEVDPPLGAAQGTYTPPPGENGNVSFQYVVEGACGRRDSGRVTIDVNHDPTAGAVSVAMLPGEQRADRRRRARLRRRAIDGIDRARRGSGMGHHRPRGRWDRPRPSGGGSSTTFAATLTDPGGLSARATVSVTVADGAPIANADRGRHREPGRSSSTCSTTTPTRTATRSACRPSRRRPGSTAVGS